MKRLLALLTPLFFLFMSVGTPAFAGSAGGSPIQKQEVKHSANTISKAEAKTMKKGLKQSLRNLADDNKMLAAIIAFFVPFLGVLIYEGELTSHFWISLVLSLLFWLPGFIYALWVIFKS